MCVDNNISFDLEMMKFYHQRLKSFHHVERGFLQSAWARLHVFSSGQLLAFEFFWGIH